MAERVTEEPMSVCQCLYNPSLRWGMLPDGNMLLRLMHPEFGDIDCILPKESAGRLLGFLGANFEPITAPTMERLQ